MKNKLFIMFLAFIAVAMVYSNAGAISGQCADCHTMHNSQDGSDENTDGPFQRLLRADCIACHTAVGSSQLSTYNAPRVLATSDPGDPGNGNTNAGGDFYWVNTGSSDSTGHNVEELPGDSGDDTIAGNTPPGWDATATASAGIGQIDVAASSSWSSQLTCAGQWGCHGNHSDADPYDALDGAHHANSNGSLTSATTVGNSYRFLKGIHGYEDANWNWNETTSAHNEYKGVNDTSNREHDISTTQYSDTTTISYLCAECHGVFHAQVAETNSQPADGGPWRRHPTDFIIPSAAEYTAVTGATNYDLDAPVARTDVSSSRANVAAGTDIVMCLSCHRAHGSNQPDLLRWDYDTMVAGASTSSGGCMYCHASKNNP